MFNWNIENIFLTSPGPGLGSSVYFVHAGGIIRAKTNANELHVRPGKNLYFIREADIDFFYSVQSPTVTYYNNGFFIYNNNNFGIQLSLTPGGEYNTPVDLYLNNNGTFAGGDHVGHQLTNSFNGTCPPINGTLLLGLVLYRIASHVTDTVEGNFSLTTDTPINL